MSRGSGFGRHHPGHRLGIQQSRGEGNGLGKSSRANFPAPRSGSFGKTLGTRLAFSTRKAEPAIYPTDRRSFFQEKNPAPAGFSPKNPPPVSSSAAQTSDFFQSLRPVPAIVFRRIGPVFRKSRFRIARCSACRAPGLLVFGECHTARPPGPPHFLKSG